MTVPIRPAWEYPVLLGRRLCWFDGEANRTLPIIGSRPLYIDERAEDPNEYGYFATLPTENGVTAELTYDPGCDDEDRELNSARGECLSLWLYVKHPETDKLCAARIEGDSAVYDFWCGNEDQCVDHEHGGWFEYVHSPDDVLDRLAHLGRLRIKAVTR